MSFYETKERHKHEDLRTHYYISTAEKICEDILKTSEELGYEVINADLERREILIEGDCSMVITVTSFGREQGVDINCDTYSFFDFGKGRRRIAEFYQKLGKKATLKGVGLHA